MIDNLPAETVEDGKAHPFVVALVKELEKRRKGYLDSAESETFATPERLRTCLNSAAAYREVIRIITTATGKEET